MVNPIFYVPYPRPQSLSDPFHDNFSSTLEQLLNTPDERLDLSDFRILLGPYLPAGTYEETCYFLPLAFRYILAHDDAARGLITKWFVQCSKHPRIADLASLTILSARVARLVLLGIRVEAST